MSTHGGPGGAGPSSGGTGPAPNYKTIQALKNTQRIKPNSKLLPRKDDESISNLKCNVDHLKIEKGDSVIYERAFGRNSGLFIEAITFRDGRTGIVLYTRMPTAKYAAANGGIEFKETEGGVRIGYVVNFERNTTEVASGEKINCRTLQITIIYKKTKLLGPPKEKRLPGTTKEFAEALDMIAAQSSELDSITSNTRLTILLPYNKELAARLDTVKNIGSIDPIQMAPKRWWRDVQEFKTILSAAVSYEYTRSVKDAMGFRRTNLIAKFVNLDQQTVNDEVSGKDSESKGKQPKGYEPKIWYRFIFRNGPQYDRARHNKDQVMTLKPAVNMKWIVEWHQKDDSPAAYMRTAGISTETEISLVRESQDVVMAVQAEVRQSDVRKLNSNSRFTIVPSVNETVSKRINKSLDMIANADPSKPNAELYKCFLYGQSSKQVVTHEELVAVYREYLAISGLDKYQIQAGLAGLTHNFTIIQGPLGTGKSQVVIQMIAATLRGSKMSGSTVKVLVTAPSNSATNNLAWAWHRFLAGNPTYDFDGINAIRFIADAYHEPSREMEEGSEGPSIAQTICFELLNPVKGEFPQAYSLIEHRKDYPEWLDALQKEMDEAIFAKAKVVFTTCTASKGQQMERYYKPDFVIVDDAGNASEPETIVPLSFDSVKQVVLVWDSMQLPPVNGHDIPILQHSMLERLLGLQTKVEEIFATRMEVKAVTQAKEVLEMNCPNCGHLVLFSAGEEKQTDSDEGKQVNNVNNMGGSRGEGGDNDNKGEGLKWTTLRYNYRSSDAIVRFISDQFYGGLLLPTTQNFNDHDFIDAIFNNGTKYSSAIVWQDIAPNTDFEDETTGSKFNKASARAILNILTLAEQYDVNACDIAVIPMYASQASLISRAIKKKLNKLRDVQVSTPDSFQGQERKEEETDDEESTEGGIFESRFTHRTVLNQSRWISQIHMERKPEWKAIRPDVEAAQIWNQNLTSITSLLDRHGVRWTIVHLGTVDNEAAVAIIYDPEASRSWDEDTVESELRSLLLLKDIFPRLEFIGAQVRRGEQLS
ncbi:hypothetical protein H072_11245 [Dactylellina haptotyla CBS 200.50]|uniref:DNA2/NAM7 helicase-like C-terminal domain-containing protein n=1 Tax=Dactylellina haptotyla (strain CBS 200.50) TaxID=1284197 RepID=S8B8P0_DACHA|nr:hypothetical protein H072_11245 [Dactylellina haptotyla CBS 200.50]